MYNKILYLHKRNTSTTTKYTQGCKQMTVIVIEPKQKVELLTLQNYEPYLNQVDTLKLFIKKAHKVNRLNIRKSEVNTLVEVRGEVTTNITAKTVVIRDYKLLTTLTDGKTTTQFEHHVDDMDSVRQISQERAKLLKLDLETKPQFKRLNKNTDKEIMALLDSLTVLQVDRDYHKDQPEVIVIVSKVNYHTTVVTVKINDYTLCLTKHNNEYHVYYSKLHKVEEHINIDIKDFGRVVKRFIINPTKQLEGKR